MVRKQFRLFPLYGGRALEENWHGKASEVSESRDGENSHGNRAEMERFPRIVGSGGSLERLLTPRPRIVPSTNAICSAFRTRDELINHHLRLRLPPASLAYNLRRGIKRILLSLVDLAICWGN